MKRLTAQQQELFDQLKSGRYFATFNAHHFSGGEYRFVDTGELVRYRTFWNLVRATKDTDDEIRWQDYHMGNYACDFSGWDKLVFGSIYEIKPSPERLDQLEYFAEKQFFKSHPELNP